MRNPPLGLAGARVGVLFVLLALVSVRAAERVPKPLFADPNYHGSCDSEVV